jgi:predicted nucleic acid-binding protein
MTPGHSSGSPLQIVMDASVLVKAFVEEPQSDRADALLAHLTRPGTQIHVPELLYIEVANILWKSVRRSRVSAQDAQAILSAVHTLNLTAHRMTEVSEVALGIALAHHITAYDASYVALAELLGLTLVTADYQLVDALCNSPYKVQALVAFPIPDITL